MTTVAPEEDRVSAAQSGHPTPGIVRRSSWQVLRCQDFRLYFLGSVGSNLGTWLQNTAQVLLAYGLTRSVFAVGLVVSAQFAGTLLLSPWAAVLADRIGTKKTLVGTQCVSAITAGLMGGLYYDRLLNEHALIAGALVLGLAFSLALPVQTALVAELVEPADIQPAMAMNSVSYNSGRAFAPALCVLVFAFVGPDLIFALNALSFTVFAAILSRLEADSGLKAVRGCPAEGPHQQPRRAGLADGFRVARRNRRILFLLAVVAAVTVADDPIQVLGAGLAHTLHVPSGWAAYFIAALGWGTVLGSLPPTARREVVNPSDASRRVAWSLLVLALSVFVFALGLSAPISLIAAFATGGAALFTGAAAQTLIVGRHRKAAASVAGLWAIAWAGTKPVASLLDGWLASHLGIFLTGAILAAPAAALALGELAIPSTMKESIKKWSLSNYLDRIAFLLLGVVLYILDWILTPLRLDRLRGEDASDHGAIKHAS